MREYIETKNGSLIHIAMISYQEYIISVLSRLVSSQFG